jgi:molybdopterin converting factor small subunit
MPTVKIVIYAGLRIRLGWKERTVGLPDNCNNIECMLDNFPEIKKELSDYIEKGYTPIILVNGRNVFLGKGLKEEIHDNDRIDIFPPSAGGFTI